MTRIISVIIIAFLTLIDQLLKFLCEKRLMPVGRIDLIPGIIELKYLENTGAAFGAMSGKTLFLSAFTVVILTVCFIAMMSGKIKDKFVYFCGIMIVSGGLGNLIDRIFRRYVIDYINFLFVDFAVFNFADCLITAGCIMLVVYIIFKDIGKKKKDKNSE